MKIICIGRNYVDHAKELSNPIPDNPLVFMKPSTAILHENKPFYHPEYSNEIHYEVEVVVKICKNGKYVQPEHADSYYQEIGLGIDFTARDIQKKCKEKGHPWEIAKAFNHSAVIGDYINKSDLPHIQDLNFTLNLNGKEVQNGNTKDMIFDVNHLICYVSQYFTLQVGDLIFTGTPAGVGKVAIGDKLEGFLQQKLMFKCEIK